MSALARPFIFWQRQLGNPEELEASRPRWETGESDRALDRQRLLRSSNTVSFFTPGTPNLAAIEVEAGPLNVNTVLFVEGQPKLTNLTPFRKMMNAGDILGSINANPLGNTLGEGWRSMYWGITDQVSSTRRASNAGWNHLAGSARPGWIDNNSPYAGIGGFVSLWTGNPKFVYDGSDYTRFRALQAKNRNFNDPTFGGDQHNASQVPKARARR